MSNTTKIVTYRDSFNRAVKRSIESGTIDRDLYRTARACGEDYNEVVDHIASEVRLNK